MMQRTFMISVTDPSLSMRIKAFGAKLLDPAAAASSRNAGRLKPSMSLPPAATPPFRNIRRDRLFPGAEFSGAESLRSAVMDLSRLTSMMTWIVFKPGIINLSNSWVVVQKLRKLQSVFASCANTYLQSLDSPAQHVG